MSEETNGKIAKRKAEVEVQFNKIETERKGLVSQRNELTSQISNIDRRLGEIAGIQRELQGRYAELDILLEGDKKDKKAKKTN